MLDKEKFIKYLKKEAESDSRRYDDSNYPDKTMYAHFETCILWVIDKIKTGKFDMKEPKDASHE